MGLGNHFVFCDICGGAGHKAKNCALQQLEARRDPFGEEIRKGGYRRRVSQRPSTVRSNEMLAMRRAG